MLGVGGCVAGYMCHDAIKAREERKARKRAERMQMLGQCTGLGTVSSLPSSPTCSRVQSS